MLNILILSLIVSLAINMAMFLVAYKFQSDKLTDISYALTFIVLSLLVFTNTLHQVVYSSILVAMVCVWAIRIGWYLLQRVLKVGKDKRFDGMREDFVKFGRFWLGQAITVWVLTIPMELAAKKGSKFTAIACVGLAIWFSGFIIEAISDYEKKLFRDNPKNSGKWIEDGLWGYSRHPNYFGEILVWTGIYLASFSHLNTAQRLVCLVSPLYITLLLRFVSGVPMLEKSAEKKWGKLSAYKKYKQRTNLIIPVPKSW
jgi:steroid 5-alpha reductase family enzyme